MNELLSALINSVAAGAGLVMMMTAVIRLSRKRWNAATLYLIWWATLVITLVLPLTYLQSGETEGLPAVSIAISNEVESEAVPVLERPASSWMSALPIHVNAGPWALRLLLVWAGLGVILLLRLIASFLSLERRKASSKEPLPELLAASDEILCRSGRRKIRLALSPEIGVPVAAGPYRPTILIPESMVERLSPDEIRQVCLHESAHFRRHDDYVLLLQRFIEAVFVFHPIVRWIFSRIDREREIACDDFALESSGDPKSYASALVKLAGLATGNGESALAPSIFRSGSSLENRIARLFDRRRSSGIRILKARFLAISVALVAMGPRLHPGSAVCGGSGRDQGRTERSDRSGTSSRPYGRNRGCGSHSFRANARAAPD